MDSDHKQLIQQAKAVLNGNWTGAFTKPAPRLYLHQWSWDSAFIAIAYDHYDQARAEQELCSFFQGPRIDPAPGPRLRPGPDRPKFPFLVQDVLFNTLLCQANRDLAEIATILGEDPTPFEAWAETTAEAINTKLWDEEHGIYLDFDVVGGEPVPAHVAAGFTPLYAGIPDTGRAQRMCGYLNTSCFCRLDEPCYAVPSYDKGEPGYSPTRPWRGPIWININWLLYRGLRRYGHHEYAQWVRQAIIGLPRRHGFYEYYDPDRGQGHGSDHFSWTAALMLDVLCEEGEKD